MGSSEEHVGSYDWDPSVEDASSGVPLMVRHQKAGNHLADQPLIGTESFGIPSVGNQEEASPIQGPTNMNEPGTVSVIPEDPPEKQTPALQWHLIDNDDTPRKLGKALVCEFLGTLMLVGFGIGAANPLAQGSLDKALLPLYAPNFIIAASLSVGATIHICRNSSGGHVNPSVTLALFLDKRISALRCITYLLSQFAGGIAGAALIYVLCNYHNRPKTNFGVIAYDLDVYTYPQVFFNEVFGTMLLNLTVFASFVEETSDAGSYKQCLSIAIVCMIANPMCCINPARGLAFNLITLQMVHHAWVSILGPFVGAALATLIYNFLLKSPPRPHLVKAK